MATLSMGELFDLTAALSRQAGRAPPQHLTPLAGGKNNRVFRVSLADGGTLVLKSYFYNALDPRDRLGAEWEFVSYAWARGVRNLPQPIARDPKFRLGLYAFVAGRKLAIAEIDNRHIAAAADFVIEINRAPRQPMKLAPGSEACFSLQQHIDTVERRTARLTALDPEPEDRDLVESFVRSRLIPAWRAVKSRLESAIARSGFDAGDILAPDDIIISPSDFGFHNALFDGVTGRLTFIDFEYAGRDDPAKLICDFFCQPEIPAPAKAFETFVDQALAGLSLASPHPDRCRMLLDLYHIKWACIILNQFMPLGAARRAFAEHETGPDRGVRQIARAEAQLAGISA
jgi:hypothetical protein